MKTFLLFPSRVAALALASPTSQRQGTDHDALEAHSWSKVDSKCSAFLFQCRSVFGLSFFFGGSLSRTSTSTLTLTLSTSTTNLKTIQQASLSASAAYSQPLTHASSRSVTRMAGGTPAGAGSGGRRSGRAPPDLPSLLLDSRIVYIGMALVPEVTELIVSELLWLNYAAPDKPVFIYVQSTGSQTLDGQAIAVEQEAFAIIDTMDYIAPKKFTIVIGQALGTAALVAMSGTRGCRYALPHARLQLSPPRLNRTWARTSNLMLRANELEDTTNTYVEFMSRATTAPPDVCRKAISRNRWLTPEVAIKAGIIDKVYDNGLGERLAKERTDYEEIMRKRAAAEGKKGSAAAPQGLPAPGGPSSGA